MALTMGGGTEGDPIVLGAGGGRKRRKASVLAEITIQTVNVYAANAERFMEQLIEISRVESIAAMGTPAPMVPLYAVPVATVAGS